MEKNVEVSLLFFFFVELLKPSCRQAIDLYYNEDLSLAEIAAQTGITRQGVRDSIRVEFAGQRAHCRAHLRGAANAGVQALIVGLTEGQLLAG